MGPLRAEGAGGAVRGCAKTCHCAHLVHRFSLLCCLSLHCMSHKASLAGPPKPKLWPFLAAHTAHLLRYSIVKLVELAAMA